MNIDKAFKELLSKGEGWYFKTHKNRRKASLHKKMFETAECPYYIKEQYLLDSGYSRIREEAWGKETKITEEELERIYDDLSPEEIDQLS